MSILNKTDKNITVVSVKAGDIEGDIIVTTEDSNDRVYEWMIQTTEGRYDYSGGCLLFVDGIEFDYRYETTNYQEVFEHHRYTAVNAANNYEEENDEA